MNEMSAPGGTWLACIVAMVDLVTRDSYANVNAECKCPDSWRYRYTRKLTSSADTAMSEAARGESRESMISAGK